MACFESGVKIQGIAGGLSDWSKRSTVGLRK